MQKLLGMLILSIFSMTYVMLTAPVQAAEKKPMSPLQIRSKSTDPQVKEFLEKAKDIKVPSNVAPKADSPTLTISGLANPTVTWDATYDHWINENYKIDWAISPAVTLPLADKYMAIFEGFYYNGEEYYYMTDIATTSPSTVFLYGLGCRNIRAALVDHQYRIVSNFSNTIEVCAEDPTLTGLRFPDVPDETTFAPHIFYAYIESLAADGVVSGFPDGYFRPELAVTRGAMAKFIVNAFEFPIDTSCGATFTDVDTDHVFYDYIMTLRCNNVVSGYPDGAFQPEGIVDRGAATKFIINGARIKKGDDAFLPNTQSGQVFSDVPIDHVFYSYIMAAYSNTIVNGYGGGYFDPTGVTTRGAMSKMVDLTRKKL